MAFVSGKTYDHREYLKTVANWDKVAKVWRLPDTATDYIAHIRTLTGCIVTMDNDQPQASAADEAVERRDEPTENKDEPTENKTVIIDPAISSPSVDGTIYYGDETNYGPFAPGKPDIYYGFSSLDTMCDFIEHKANRREIWNESPHFAGSDNMEHAFRLAREGWFMGVERARKVMDLLTSEQAVVRDRLYDVAGGRVNVGKMLTGNPVHMSRRARQPGRKVVTLYVSIDAQSDIKAMTMAMRAGVIAAICDILETSGYSCEIIAGGFATLHNHNYVQFTTVLKRAADPMNINDVVFGVGHPSMLRRLAFALTDHDERSRRVWNGHCYSAAFYNDKVPAEPNSFYIDYLKDNAPAWLEFNDQVRWIVQKILPKNFPVTLK